MTGPCLCGDIYCPSCGPAQGNHRCDICGRWTDEGGCADPEACAKAARERDDALARDLEEAEKLAQEYWNGEARAHGSRYTDNEDGGSLDETPVAEDV